MNLDLGLYFSEAIESYKSLSQQVRSATERWAGDNLYCPRCGQTLIPYPTNTPVYDFHCDHLKYRFMVLAETERDNFQLKSMKSYPHGNFPARIIGAEYKTTMKSLMEGLFPSLILLHYERKLLEIQDALLIHRLSMTPSSIIPRNPLKDSARRKGWQGSMISLETIPQIGKIPVINNSNIIPKRTVMEKWSTVEKVIKGSLEQRGWTSDIIAIVEGFQRTFTLEDLYSFSPSLAEKHPNNKHIKDKIRQQLQILRDRGYLEFKGSGKYEKIA